MTPEVSKTWLNALDRKSDAEIKIGLRKAESFTGFFSLPAFIDLCSIKPEDVGLPTSEEAWKEAGAHCHDTRNYKWSNIAVYKALLDFGVFDFRNMTNIERDKKRFYEVYAGVCRQYIENGGKLDIDVPERIAHQPEVKSSPECQGYQDFRKALEGL